MQGLENSLPCGAKRVIRGAKRKSRSVPRARRGIGCVVGTLDCQALVGSSCSGWVQTYQGRLISGMQGKVAGIARLECWSLEVQRQDGCGSCL